MLYVNRATALRAAACLLASGATIGLLASAATDGAGSKSLALRLCGSPYSSVGKSLALQNFVWQVQSVGDNIASLSPDLVSFRGAVMIKPSVKDILIGPNGQISSGPGRIFQGVGTGSGTVP